MAQIELNNENIMNILYLAHSMQKVEDVDKVMVDYRNRMSEVEKLILIIVRQIILIKWPN